jgi:hypothetical protein
MTVPDQDKWEQAIRYGQRAGCRWMHLFAYFDNPVEKPRGASDNSRRPLEARIAQRS